MGFLDSYKITGTEIAQNKVQSAPDTLTGTAQDNKKVFDKLAELIASKVNNAIEKIGSDLNDLSSTKGKTGNWRWEKKANGECVGRLGPINSTGVTFVASGSLYRSSEISVNLPFTFVTIEAPIVTIASSSAATWTTLYSAPTNTNVSFVAVKGGSASADITYWIEVTGTWK